MAKRKNSGIYRQEQIIGQFSRDSRSSNQGSAVAQAIRTGKKNAEYRAEQERKAEAAPRISPKFLVTGR